MLSRVGQHYEKGIIHGGQEEERTIRGACGMKASDVMVTSVVTVGPDARVFEVAQQLLNNRISAIPVVGDKGEILGIVSEGDLLNRHEAETTHRKSWWLELLASRETMAADYVRSHSQHVTDVMTRNVITAPPEMLVADLASLLETHRIKRVPIVKDGKMIGIVSRANLLQGLVRQRDQVQLRREDSAIRNDIVQKLHREFWARPSLVCVAVHDGTVDLTGIVDSQVEKTAIAVLAEEAIGVRGVSNELRIRPLSSDG